MSGSETDEPAIPVGGETPPPQTPPQRRSRARRLLKVAIGAIVLAGAAVVLLALAWDAAMAPHGRPGAEVRVSIPPGTSARRAGEILADEGLLRHPLLLPILIRLDGGVLKAGEYRFRPPLTPRELLALLERGGEPPPFLRVTVPEGLRMDQLAEVVEQAGLGSCDDLLALARDPSAIRDLDPLAGDLEGYLFPDTYHLPLDACVRDLVAAMVGRFRSVTAAEIARGTPALPLRAWVTLASLVEEETPRHEERPLVASVYWSRLQRGMLLQCDPTVVYAMVLARLPSRELMISDLSLDHPYNTYLFPGLPPGPIASPGLASLRAAASPVVGENLYFVATGDGGHRFSRTFGEHQAAVAAYRRHRAELRRERRAGS